MFSLNISMQTKNIPAGTQHQNDVISTSMRRDHVALTLMRRHFNVVCPLGSGFDLMCSFLGVYDISLPALNWGNM